MAPGPVFIHAAHCRAYDADGFPETLREVPLAFEARASGSRITELSARADVSPEAQMQVLFDDRHRQLARRQIRARHQPVHAAADDDDIHGQRAFLIARSAAFRPGAAMMPPPGCVAEPHI